MVKPFGRILGCAVVALGVAGCGRGPSPAISAKPAAPAVNAGWSMLTRHFIDEYCELEPMEAVVAGRHEFDGRMPDWSAQGIAKEVEWLKRSRGQVTAFDAAQLNARERFERKVLLSVLDRELFWLDRARFPFGNPAWYIDRLDPDVYLNRNYAPLQKRLAGYIGYASAIPALIADIEKNIQLPLPRTFIERGVKGFGGYADFYRHDVLKVFDSVTDADLKAKFAAANEAAAQAMEQATKWLESGRDSATDRFALGAPLFTEMLQQTEQVNVPLDELTKIGRADLERNTQALLAACGEYLPRAPVQVCIDSMNSKKPEGGAVAGARAQLRELKKFVQEKGIVTINGNEDALVKEAPPYQRANFAYISVPGPYETNMPSIYYVAPPDPNWSPAERAAYVPGQADLLYTSVHEVWPGHFLQFLHSNRNPSKVEALWVGYAFAEGWAHYAEEMMWEEGLGNGDPQQHIGQLTNALLRDVRFLSAIGLNTGTMTVKQSEQMFRDRAYQDPGNARQQAARGTYDPAYLNYTLGKLMIRKLRQDWVARQPPVADPRQHWRAFHDRFLSYGGPPIPLIRREMLGEGGALF